MKKGILLLFILPIAGWALPVGNPADPSIYSKGVWSSSDSCESSWANHLALRAGYYGDFVFNGHVKRTNHTGQIEQLQMNTNAGLLSVNIVNRVDLFGLIGATHAEAVSHSVHGDYRFELEYDTHYSWGVGARAVLWKWSHATLGLEGQYFAYSPSIMRYEQIGTDSEYPDAYAHARFYEWQVGLGLSYRICNFVPYIAIEGSYLSINNKQSTVLGVTLNNFESAKYIGYAVGVTLVDDDKATLTVEGRFADQLACCVNGQFRF